MNWLNQLYVLWDRLQEMGGDSSSFLGRLRENHVFLLEVMGLVVLSLIVFYILLKPSQKKNYKDQNAAAPTVQKVNSRVQTKMPQQEPQLVMPQYPRGGTGSLKSIQEEGLQKQNGSSGESALPVAAKKNFVQDLSLEEEAALEEAIEEAGKQALAESIGGPHQAQIFEEESVKEAAKRMFARSKEAVEASLMQVPLKKVQAERDFLMLYYMAPLSEAYRVAELFRLFQDFNLYFNEDHIFEYTDQHGLQFYIASAVKPGIFELQQEAYIPGLSFVLDLQKTKDGRGAFNKMLIFIDALSKHLKGHVLDDQRRKMTADTMTQYLAHIKSYMQAVS